MPLSKITTASISTAAATSNLNFDNGTLFVDVTNDRVGVGTTAPTYSLQVQKAGQTNMSLYNSTNAVELRMIADSSGAYVQTNTNHPLWFATNNGAVQMVLDTSGRITKPYQPAFFAYGYSASSGYFNNDYIGNNTNFNVGSCYSTSTKRFTAPVTGTYFFTGGALKYNTNTSWTAVVINGSTTPTSGYSYAENASGNESITYSALIQLNAGDYAKFYAFSAGTNGFYDNGNSQYHWFAGYLLG